MRARNLSLLFGLLTLCCFQMIGAAQEKTYPPPGKLVDVGGWRLHLNCTGKGKGKTPTVVLEAGAGDFSFDWGLVQPEVARFARVCSYDRAGYAWSEAGPTPRTMQQIVYELRASLANAGIKPPYVLVGHSLGGLIVRKYASQYPNDVAGMVLVDSSHEDQMISTTDRTTREEKVVRWREQASGKPIPPIQTSFQRTAGAAQPGAPSGTRSSLEAPYNKLPTNLQQTRHWAMSQPDYGPARSSETFPFLADELAQMHTERGNRKQPLNDLPLFVLTNGIASEEKLRLQTDLVSLSSNSQQIIAKQSGHHIHLDEPAVVTSAIQQVVEAAQRGAKLLPSPPSNQNSLPAQSYPPPGKLVDVGGWRLHLNCTGKSKGKAPTVVLEAGSGDFSVDWSLAQPEVARIARVCSYDRAGAGWSELGPRPRTMRQAVYELHTALQKAGEKGPYVLVGQSLGGLMIRVFASQYPKEVAGMVLVDSTHEDTVLMLNGKLQRMRELARGRTIPPVRTTILDAEKELSAEEKQQAENNLKQRGAPKISGPFSRLPAEMQAARLWALTQPRHQMADSYPYLSVELAEIYDVRQKQEYPLGDIPLAVLLTKPGFGNPPPGISAEEWKQVNEESRQNKIGFAKLSRNSKLIVAENSGHHIQLDEPAVVASAIQQVIDAVRRGAKLLP